MFSKVNSSLIYFQEIFLINFYVRILHRIAVLICHCVLVYKSRESGDVVQIVSKSKLSALLQAKSHTDTVCLFPIYAVCKIMKAKVCL